jgi:hypothetical protein
MTARIGSDFIQGTFAFYDNNLSAIAVFDGTEKSLSIPAGSKLIVNNIDITKTVIEDSSFNVPTLVATAFTISDGGNKIVQWMSADRVTLYGIGGVTLYKSIDDGTSWTTIKAFATSIQGVRELDNGELLVTLWDGGTNAGTLQLSSGYPALGASASWSVVLTASDVSTYIEPHWGMSVYKNIVVVSEYGGYTKARYAYLSTNYGATFAQIFDLGTTAVSHIHGCAYDPWWDAIWIVNGDTSANKALRVSWDRGSNWVIVSTAVQYTAILPMENCILFGTDGAPNGIHRIPRTPDRTLSTPVVAHLCDSSITQTAVVTQPFRAKGINMPALFPVAVTGTGYGKYVATYDGFNFSTIFTDTLSYTTKGPQTLIGPTINGKMVGAIYDGRQANFSQIVFTAPPTVTNDGIIAERSSAITTAINAIYTMNPGFYLAATTGVISTSTRSDAVMYAQPIYISRSVVLDRISLEVTSGGGAGSVTRLGIYAADKYGIPYALVLDAGTIDSTQVAVGEINISQALSPGLYYFVAASQGNPAPVPTVRCNGANPSFNIGSSTAATVSTGTALAGYTNNAVSGALPSTFTISGSSGTCPRVMVRIKS